jgi:hypothetical protein
LIWRLIAYDSGKRYNESNHFVKEIL